MCLTSEPARWFFPVPRCFGGFGLQCVSVAALRDTLRANHTMAEGEGSSDVAPLPQPDVTHLRLDECTLAVVRCVGVVVLCVLLCMSWSWRQIATV